MLISEANKLDFEQFTAVFGNVIEHCPIIAAAVWVERPFQNLSSLHEALCKFVDQLPVEGRAGILRCHPDLAGRLAAAGELTDESKLEQKAAGLDDMTSEEKERLQTYNQKYKSKFGFPFVICARQNRKEAILKGIAERLENDRSTEIETGVTEVKKICMLRLKNILDDTNDRPKL